MNFCPNLVSQLLIAATFVFFVHVTKSKFLLQCFFKQECYPMEPLKVSKTVQVGIVDIFLLLVNKIFKETIVCFN